MNLTITEYQTRAWSTAIYNNKGNNLEYISLGLGGESGEVQEYLKKTLHRGQDLPMEFLKKELGDVLWYLAGTASECKLELSQAFHNIRRPINTFNEFRTLIDEYYYRYGESVGIVGLRLNKHIVRLQECLETFRPGNTTPLLHIFHCLEWLTVLCNIYGFSLEDVALTNLEKLSVRQEQGTLAGEGDLR